MAYFGAIGARQCLALDVRITVTLITEFTGYPLDIVVKKL